MFLLMKNFARYLLIAVLALAVPFQAALAVSAAQCMAFEHQDTAPQHAGHSHDGHQDHQDQDHQDHQDHPGQPQDQQQVQGPHSHADGDDGGHGHCGPCAACCASAAIAASIEFPSRAVPSRAAYVFPDLPRIGVLPSGLDRPPLAL
jgi:hypothetical protein